MDTLVPDTKEAVFLAERLRTCSKAEEPGFLSEKRMFCNGKEPYAKMVPTVGVCTGSSTYKVYQESELPGGVFPRESVKDRKVSLRLLRQETTKREDNCGSHFSYP